MRDLEAPPSNIAPPPSHIAQLSSATFDTVVRVRGDNQLGGSGVLVDCDGQAVILTAEHVVRGASRVTITFRDGQRFASQEILIDRGRLDLAAVLIDRPRQIEPAGVGEMPRAGDLVMACGYGTEDRLAGLPNTVRGVRFSRLGGGGAEADSLEMLGTFRSGDSGGPVFNRSEQVVAIINASSAPGAANQSNVAVCCRPIRAFLARLRERLGRRQGRSEKAEGRGKSPPSGEIAPGIGIPKVELPGSDGCRCDNAAVLKKLDVLLAGAKESEDRSQESGRALQQSLSTQLEDLKKQVGAVAKRDDIVAAASAQQSEIENLKSKIVNRAPAAGMTLGKLLAGALGLSTPVGFGLGLAGWLIGRRLKKRIKRAEDADTENPRVAASPCPRVTPPAERTVILETPPPPQVIERQQQFVPYQAQSVRLDALERAMAEYVRKYPNAAGIFETINVYADQFQSGEAKPKPKNDAETR